jgi:hypothetical protein
VHSPNENTLSHPKRTKSCERYVIPVRGHEKDRRATGHAPPGTGSEIGTGGFNQPDEGDAQRLWNLASRIPEAQRFRRKYRGRNELIDHIFVSHALVGKIAQDHVITDAAGPTPSIDDDPTKRRGAPGSDHRAVLASIDV